MGSEEALDHEMEVWKERCRIDKERQRRITEFAKAYDKEVYDPEMMEVHKRCKNSTGHQLRDSRRYDSDDNTWQKCALCGAVITMDKKYNYVIINAETREVVYRGVARDGQPMIALLPEHLRGDGRKYLIGPAEWEQDPDEWGRNNTLKKLWAV